MEKKTYQINEVKLHANYRKTQTVSLYHLREATGNDKSATATIHLSYCCL